MFGNAYWTFLIIQVSEVLYGISGFPKVPCDTDLENVWESNKLEIAPELLRPKGHLDENLLFQTHEIFRPYERYKLIGGFNHHGTDSGYNSPLKLYGIIGGYGLPGLQAYYASNNLYDYSGLHKWHPSNHGHYYGYKLQGFRSGFGLQDQYGIHGTHGSFGLNDHNDRYGYHGYHSRLYDRFESNTELTGYRLYDLHNDHGSHGLNCGFDLHDLHSGHGSHALYKDFGSKDYRSYQLPGDAELYGVYIHTMPHGIDGIYGIHDPYYSYYGPHRPYNYESGNLKSGSLTYWLYKDYGMKDGYELHRFRDGYGSYRALDGYASYGSHRPLGINELHSFQDGYRPHILQGTYGSFRHPGDFVPYELHGSYGPHNFQGYDLLNIHGNYGLHGPYSNYEPSNVDATYSLKAPYLKHGVHKPYSNYGLSHTYGKYGLYGPYSNDIPSNMDGTSQLNIPYVNYGAHNPDGSDGTYQLNWPYINYASSIGHTSHLNVPYPMYGHMPVYKPYENDGLHDTYGKYILHWPYNNYGPNNFDSISHLNVPHAIYGVYKPHDNYALYDGYGTKRLNWPYKIYEPNKVDGTSHLKVSHASYGVYKPHDSYELYDKSGKYRLEGPYSNYGLSNTEDTSHLNIPYVNYGIYKPHGSGGIYDWPYINYGPNKFGSISHLNVPHGHISGYKPHVSYGSYDTYEKDRSHVPYINHGPSKFDVTSHSNVPYSSYGVYNPYVRYGLQDPYGKHGLYGPNINYEPSKVDSISQLNTPYVRYGAYKPYANYGLYDTHEKYRLHGPYSNYGPNEVHSTSHLNVPRIRFRVYKPHGSYGFYDTYGKYRLHGPYSNYGPINIESTSQINTPYDNYEVYKPQGDDRIHDTYGKYQLNSPSISYSPSKFGSTSHLNIPHISYGTDKPHVSYGQYVSYGKYGLDGPYSYVPSKIDAISDMNVPHVNYGIYKPHHNDGLYNIYGYYGSYGPYSMYGQSNTFGFLHPYTPNINYGASKPLHGYKEQTKSIHYLSGPHVSHGTHNIQSNFAPHPEPSVSESYELNRKLYDPHNYKIVNHPHGSSVIDGLHGHHGHVLNVLTGPHYPFKNYGLNKHHKLHDLSEPHYDHATHIPLHGKEIYEIHGAHVLKEPQAIYKPHETDVPSLLPTLIGGNYGLHAEGHNLPDHYEFHHLIGHAVTYAPHTFIGGSTLHGYPHYAALDHGDIHGPYGNAVVFEETKPIFVHDTHDVHLKYPVPHRQNDKRHFIFEKIVHIPVLPVSEYRQHISYTGTPKPTIIEPFIDGPTENTIFIEGKKVIGSGNIDPIYEDVRSITSRPNNDVPMIVEVQTPVNIKPIGLPIIQENPVIAKPPFIKDIKPIVINPIIMENIKPVIFKPIFIADKNPVILHKENPIIRNEVLVETIKPIILKPITADVGKPIISKPIVTEERKLPLATSTVVKENKADIVGSEKTVVAESDSYISSKRETVIGDTQYVTPIKDIPHSNIMKDAQLLIPKSNVVQETKPIIGKPILLEDKRLTVNNPVIIETVKPIIHKDIIMEKKPVNYKPGFVEEIKPKIEGTETNITAEKDSYVVRTESTVIGDTKPSFAGQGLPSVADLKSIDFNRKLPIIDGMKPHVSKPTNLEDSKAAILKPLIVDKLQSIINTPYVKRSQKKPAIVAPIISESKIPIIKNVIVAEQTKPIITKPIILEEKPSIVGTEKSIILEKDSYAVRKEATVIGDPKLPIPSLVLPTADDVKQLNLGQKLPTVDEIDEHFISKPIIPKGFKPVNFKPLKIETVQAIITKPIIVKAEKSTMVKPVIAGNPNEIIHKNILVHPIKPIAAQRLVVESSKPVVNEPLIIEKLQPIIPKHTTFEATKPAALTPIIVKDNKPNIVGTQTSVVVEKDTYVARKEDTVIGDNVLENHPMTDVNKMDLIEKYPNINTDKTLHIPKSIVVENPKLISTKPVDLKSKEYLIIKPVIVGKTKPTIDKEITVTEVKPVIGEHIIDENKPNIVGTESNITVEKDSYVVRNEATVVGNAKPSSEQDIHENIPKGKHGIPKIHFTDDDKENSFEPEKDTSEDKEPEDFGGEEHFDVGDNSHSDINPTVSDTKHPDKIDGINSIVHKPVVIQGIKPVIAKPTMLNPVINKPISLEDKKITIMKPIIPENIKPVAEIITIGEVKPLVHKSTTHEENKPIVTGLEKNVNIEKDSYFVHKQDTVVGNIGPKDVDAIHSPSIEIKQGDVATKVPISLKEMKPIFHKTITDIKPITLVPIFPKSVEPVITKAVILEHKRPIIKPSFLNNVKPLYNKPIIEETKPIIVKPIFVETAQPTLIKHAVPVVKEPKIIKPIVLDEINPVIVGTEKSIKVERDSYIVQKEATVVGDMRPIKETDMQPVDLTPINLRDKHLIKDVQPIHSKPIIFSDTKPVIDTPIVVKPIAVKPITIKEPNFVLGKPVAIEDGKIIKPAPNIIPISKSILDKSTVIEKNKPHIIGSEKSVVVEKDSYSIRKEDTVIGDPKIISSVNKLAVPIYKPNILAGKPDIVEVVSKPINIEPKHANNIQEQFNKELGDIEEVKPVLIGTIKTIIQETKNNMVPNKFPIHSEDKTSDILRDAKPIMMASEQAAAVVKPIVPFVAVKHPSSIKAPITDTVAHKKEIIEEKSPVIVGDEKSIVVEKDIYKTSNIATVLEDSKPAKLKREKIPLIVHDDRSVDVIDHIKPISLVKTKPIMFQNIKPVIITNKNPLLISSSKNILLSNIHPLPVGDSSSSFENGKYNLHNEVVKPIHFQTNKEMVIQDGKFNVAVTQKSVIVDKKSFQANEKATVIENTKLNLMGTNKNPIILNNKNPFVIENIKPFEFITIKPIIFDDLRANTLGDRKFVLGGPAPYKTDHKNAFHFENINMFNIGNKETFPEKTVNIISSGKLIKSNQKMGDNIKPIMKGIKKIIVQDIKPIRMGSKATTIYENFRPLHSEYKDDFSFDSRPPFNFMNDNYYGRGENRESSYEEKPSGMEYKSTLVVESTKPHEIVNKNTIVYQTAKEYVRGDERLSEIEKGSGQGASDRRNIYYDDIKPYPFREKNFFRERPIPYNFGNINDQGYDINKEYFAEETKYPAFVNKGSFVVRGKQFSNIGDKAMVVNSVKPHNIVDKKTVIVEGGKSYGSGSKKMIYVEEIKPQGVLHKNNVFVEGAKALANKNDELLDVVKSFGFDKTADNFGNKKGYAFENTNSYVPDEQVNYVYNKGYNYGPAYNSNFNRNKFDMDKIKDYVYGIKDDYGLDREKASDVYDKKGDNRRSEDLRNRPIPFILGKEEGRKNLKSHSFEDKPRYGYDDDDGRTIGHQKDFSYGIKKDFGYGKSIKYGQGKSFSISKTSDQGFDKKDIKSYSFGDKYTGNYNKDSNNDDLDYFKFIENKEKVPSSKSGFSPGNSYEFKEGLGKLFKIKINVRRPK